VTALRRMVAAMRTQVAHVSGALLELEDLRSAHAKVREEVSATIAREMEPLRDWFGVFGADAMAQIKRIRSLDGTVVDAARLVDVGLTAAPNVPDKAFSAYGNVPTANPAHHARLNNGNNGCLISSAVAGVDWIQVALPAYMVIGGLSWQGANSGNAVHQCWKTVSLRVSLDGAVWRDVDGGVTFTRPAGTADNATHTITLRVGHLCRFVRLVFHAHGAAGAGSEYVRWELKHISA
jgi:hypothetical protein